MAADDVGWLNGESNHPPRQRGEGNGQDRNTEERWPSGTGFCLPSSSLSIDADGESSLSFPGHSNLSSTFQITIGSRIDTTMLYRCPPMNRMQFTRWSGHGDGLNGNNQFLVTLLHFFFEIS